MTVRASPTSGGPRHDDSSSPPAGSSLTQQRGHPAGIAEVARFELRRRLRLVSTWVYAALLFALAFLFMLTAGGAFESATADFGKVHANAPLPVFFATSTLGIVGMFIISSIAGQAVSQDAQVGIDPFYFASPLKRAHYWIGRFVAAELLLLVLFLAVPAGLFLGANAPGLEPSYFGPNRAVAYFWPYAVVLVPNIVAFGATFFSIATLKRSMRPVHLVVILLVMGYFLAQAIGRDPDNDTIVGLLDPFAVRAARVQTRYWPIAEQNDRLVLFEGVLLWNRLLWSAIGLVALGIVALRFRPEISLGKEKKHKPPKASRSRPLPTWISAAWLETKQMVLNIYFQAVAFAGVVFTVIILSNAGSEPGWHRYPVTSQVAGIALSVFAPFGLAIITIFAGDAVWRERDARMHQLYDALPVRSWQPFVAKMIGLYLAQCLLIGLVVLSAVGVQLAQGFTAIEPRVYAEHLLFIDLPSTAILCVLAVFVQVLSPTKYVGYLMVVLYFLSTMFLDKLGFEHLLYRYGETPTPEYSDMNGFGHFLPGLLWFTAYWLFGAVLLALKAMLLYRRGEETTWRARVREARRRFVGPVRAVSFGVVLAFAATGAWIYYNTNILNRYERSSDGEKRTAEYEKQYKAKGKEPQPKIVAVELTAALRPEQREADIKGVLSLENRTKDPLTTIYVTLNDELRLEELKLDRDSTRTIDDRRHGFYALQLSQPMQPGDKATLTYTSLLRNPGFRVRNETHAVVENGTFIGEGWYPSIGYVANYEPSDDNARRRQELPEKERTADLDDFSARQFNMFNHDADWIRFAATVSTSPDQIAIAPGYLQKEWTDNGRRFFRYEMDAPMQNFYTVSSARYTVHKETHDGVNVEIYYHATHAYNVTRMAEAVKHSIATYTKMFGPYQFRQLRILEFPRYDTFAQSFPNTVPYSEAIGFVTRVDPDDPKDIDFPYFVTAHEVAHQWWGHQVIGGDVQGSAMLCESLAEYSALLVLEEKYGERMMRRYLKHELDGYLRGRSGERKKELPLYRVEGQPYIHYNKGALAFYALADRVGKDKVNAALKRFVEKTKFQVAPYTYTRELLEELRQEIPKEQHGLIEDLFEQITLFDNRATKAVAKKREDGAYEVTLEVSTKKLVADDLGKETEIAFQQLFEIGGLDANDKATAVELVLMRPGAQTVSFVSKTLPKKAGIDPLHKMIDRVINDNVVDVTVE